MTTKYDLKYEEELRKTSNRVGEVDARFSKMSVKEVMEALLSNGENKAELCKGLIESASKGNAKSAELILKIIGQDPSKTQTDDDNDPFK